MARSKRGLKSARTAKVKLQQLSMQVQEKGIDQTHDNPVEGNVKQQIVEDKYDVSCSPVKTIRGQWVGRLFCDNMVLLLLLVLPVIVVYANTLSVPFYMDDSIAISLNPKIRLTEISWDSISRFDLRSRPVAYLTFALNYYFHQYELPGYHIVNILIHLMSGVFLFFLVRETMSLAVPSKDRSRVTAIAYWASLLWLINPLCTSAVTYVVQRMTSLAAMFYVLALLLFVRGRTAAGLWRWSCYGLTLFLWLLALGTKQIAIPLPFFILLYEILFFQKIDAAWFRGNLKYFVVMIVFFACLSFLFLGTDPLKSYWDTYKVWEYTPAQRFFTEFRVVVRYLSLLFFPYPGRLVFEYNYPLSNGFFDPISTLFSMVTVVALLASAVFFTRKQPLFAFAIFWYFGNLFLESIWPTSVIFEHKAYLPTMFLFVPLCEWSVRFVDWKRFSIGALFVAATLGLWTYQRNALWHDPVALWQQSVKEYPGNARSYSGLGDALFRQGKFEEAIPYFREAVRLDPHYPDAFNNLGACLHRQKNYEEAINNFQRALALNSEYVDALANLGYSYLAVGDAEKALLYLRKAFQLAPENAIKDGQLPSAIRYAEALMMRGGGGKR